VSTIGKRRAYGQHFLKDAALTQKIAEKGIEEAEKYQCQEILEIGPGKGAITKPLLERVQGHTGIKSFVLAERDPKLVQYWKKQELPAGIPSFFIEEGDFMDAPEKNWIRSTPIAVVSNLPYSAGTAILNRLAEFREHIPVMVLMFQAEVAKRLRAEPSTPDRGSLSLWIQNQWDVQKLFHVPPRAFSPPPKVDSEVVLLTRRAAPLIAGTENREGEKIWQSLIRTLFSQRRKMLRSILHSKPEWQNALELAGVDGTKRAEALIWQEWDQLFQAFMQIHRSRNKN
jgi:16S rRNA (adenine1518-N6/adenine1519-N6)-dimethyltransferase